MVATQVVGMFISAQIQWREPSLTDGVFPLAGQHCALSSHVAGYQIVSLAPTYQQLMAFVSLAARYLICLQFKYNFGIQIDLSLPFINMLMSIFYK